MSDFFKFPSTRHLRWLSDGPVRDNKVMTAEEADVFLGRGPFCIEEKVDGANVGFSVDVATERVLVQNRGGYLIKGACHAQFQTLWDWLLAREDDIAAALFPDLVLFGEWCYARHSVEYSNLPDYFLGFDVFDRSKGSFWSPQDRNGLLDAISLAAVPCIEDSVDGPLAVDELMDMLDCRSRFGDGKLEGIVVRCLSTGERAKLVRPDFVQAIDTHWSKGSVSKQRLRWY